MSVAATIALMAEIVAVAPQAMKTGKQVIDLANSGYKALSAALKDDASPEEINALVKKIVANSIKIQSID